MRVAIGADHAGFEMKTDLAEQIRKMGHEVVDLGAHAYDAKDDYPDFAGAVARAIAGAEAERGVLVCGSGIGACIAANKVKGVRAGICTETYTAHQGVEHDDMNIVVVGARVIGIEVAREVVGAFLAARFSGEPRHQRRLEKVLAIERESC